MITTIPAVEIAHHANALRIGRPNGKARSGHAVDQFKLRPELVVNAALITFAEKVEVHFPERRQERVGVTRAAHVAAIIGNNEIVGINTVRLLAHAFKESRLMQTFQFDPRLILLVYGDNFHVSPIGNKGANDHPGTVAQRMHAQQLMRTTVSDLDQALEFGMRQNHGPALCHEETVKDTKKRRSDGRRAQLATRTGARNLFRSSSEDASLEH